MSFRETGERHENRQVSLPKSYRLWGEMVTFYKYPSIPFLKRSLHNTRCKHFTQNIPASYLPLRLHRPIRHFFRVVKSARELSICFLRAVGRKLGTCRKSDLDETAEKLMGVGTVWRMLGGCLLGVWGNVLLDWRGSDVWVSNNVSSS